MSHFPLVIPALSFMAGILCHHFAPHLPRVCAVFAVILMGAMLLLDKQTTKSIYEYIFTCFTCMAFMIMGHVAISQHIYQHPNQLESINCQKLVLSGIIQSPVKTYPQGSSFTLEVFAYRNDSLQHCIQGNVKVYFDQQSYGQFNTYDTIFVRGYLTTVQSIYRDYLSYMHSQNIYHVVYADSILTGSRQNSLQARATRMQSRFARQLSILIPEPEIQAIALAMFLGEKSQLSQGLKMRFSIAGASHILAISGMHIGIIYLILNLLFSWLHLFLYGKKLKYTVILILLLVYMGITGATPAVVRATLMFGMLLVMKLLKFRHYILNVVALASLIQMLIDPSIVYTVSFQLSYLAVSGIIVLYPQLEKYIHTPWKALNHLYSCIGITLCATLATAPLVWINFGTFPVYFLLTNILISLLSVLIVWVGFLLILLIYVPVVSVGIAGLVSILIQFLIEIISWISSLPHAQLTVNSMDKIGLIIMLSELVIAFIILLPGILRQPDNSQTPMLWN